MAVEHPHSNKNRKGILDTFKDKHVPNTHETDLPNVGGFRSGDDSVHVPFKAKRHSHHHGLALFILIAILIALAIVLF